jgi:hypothetical protein
VVGDSAKAPCPPSASWISKTPKPPAHPRGHLHAPTRRALLARQTERRQTLLRQLARARSDAIELHAGERYDRELVRFFRAREKAMNPRPPMRSGAARGFSTE